MDPSKQESVSRQSSILKPTKQRQPLQIVAANPSSSESSPTVKIKRRVSFAKNKRIREFCNEAEQGTVWDDTYEEHDLSNSKSNSTGGIENPVIINLPCDDKENFPIQLFMEPDQLECKEIILNVSNQKNDEILSDDDMDTTLNIYDPPIVQTRNQEIDCPDETIYCNDGMDETAILPSNIIPCQNDADSENTMQLGKVFKKNTTIHYNDNMEITAPIANIISSYDVKSNLTHKALQFNPVIQDIDKENSPLSIQEQFNADCDDKILSINLVKENIPTQNLTSILKKKVQYPDATMCYNDGMEMTGAIPSNIRIGNQQEDNHCTEDLLASLRGNKLVVQDPSKNLIAVNSVQDLNQSTQRVINNAKCFLLVQKNSKIPQSNTTVYYNDVMETTTVIPSNMVLNCDQDKSYYEDTLPVSQNTSANIRMDAENIPSIMQEISKKVSSNTLTLDSNQLPVNEIMNSTTLLKNKKTFLQKATVYCDDGMEMTAAIPSNIMFSGQQEKSYYEDTLPVSRNTSFIMRENVPSIMQEISKKLSSNSSTMNLNSQKSINDLIYSTSVPIKKNQYQNATVYCDDGMEMTAAVPSNVMLSCNEGKSYYEDTLPVSSLSMNTSSTLKEKVPSIMQEISKKLSSNCPSFNLKNQQPTKEVISCSSMQKNKKCYQDATVYCDEGMEMTTAISSNMVQSGTINKSYENILPVLHNAFMTVREHVPPILKEMSKKLPLNNSSAENGSYKMSTESQNLVKNKKRQLPDSTLYCMDGMEFTEAVSTCFTKGSNFQEMDSVLPQPSCDVTANLRPTENTGTSKNTATQNFDIVPKNKKMKYLNSTILGNDGMEMTEALKTNIVCNNPNVNHPNNQTITSQCTLKNDAENLLSQTTENYLKERKQCTSPTQINLNEKHINATIYCNDGMEVTAAISSNLLPNKNSGIFSCGNELPTSQKVTTQNKKSLLSSLQTKKLEINPSLEINGHLKYSDATIFCYDNMETTAAIPSTIINQKYNLTVTENLQPTSKDFIRKKMPSEVTETQEINSNKELINGSQSTVPVTMSKEIDLSNETIYCNNGMEITTAISRDVQFIRPINICQDQEIPTFDNKISDEIFTQSQNQDENRLNNLDSVSPHETLINNFNNKSQNEVDTFTRNKYEEVELQNEIACFRNDLGISVERTENIFSNGNNKNKSHLESSLALLQNNSIDETERIPTPVLYSDTFKLQVNKSDINSPNLKISSVCDNKKSLNQVQRNSIVHKEGFSDTTLINFQNVSLPEISKTILFSNNEIQNNYHASFSEIQHTQKVSLTNEEEQKAESVISDHYDVQDNSLTKKSHKRQSVCPKANEDGNDCSNNSLNLNQENNYGSFELSNQNIASENFYDSSVSKNFQTGKNSSCHEKETESESNFAVQKSLSSSKLKIQHTILVEVENVPNRLSKCRKTSDFITKDSIENFTQHDKISFSDHVSNNEMNETCFSRMPSDDTEVLIATMGLKTDLTYPLIINDKTIIKVPNDTLANKNHCISEVSNKTCIVNSQNDKINQFNGSDSNQLKTNEEWSTESSKTSITNNYIENQPKESDTEKENEETSAKIDLLSQNYLEELEEIQPPSFLCSDSIQESLQNNSVHNIETIINPDEELSLKNLNENVQLGIVLPAESKVIDQDNQHITSKFCKENEEDTKKTTEADESIKMESDCTEDIIDEWSLLLKNIKLTEQRDDCIWSTHTINSKMIALNFISESFIFVVRFNETKTACEKDIAEIELVSRLRCESKNTLIKIVHNLLILNMNPDKMLEQYKMYRDVMPMLEYVSTEVITAMKFMFNLEKISAFYLSEINPYSVSFMVSSDKHNIILKIFLPFKSFNAICPDDIEVDCILGDVSINDIKKLMRNIKKDYTYLSRYIEDVKKYITTMEESLCRIR